MTFCTHGATLVTSGEDGVLKFWSIKGNSTADLVESVGGAHGGLPIRALVPGAGSPSLTFTISIFLTTFLFNRVFSVLGELLHKTS